ncbi:MAG: hypothetical protein JNK64_33455 [Myxococcales bacterium]|nr:hypothetical protein [Myxococcales bacterium]
MRSTAPLSLLPWLSAALLTAAACTTPEDATDLGADEAAVMGGTSFDNTCPADVQAYVEDTMLHARTAIASTAFSQCLDQAMRTGITMAGASIGPYRKCNGDPYYASDIATQVARALAATRSSNSLAFSCSDVQGANASAGLGTYELVGPERMNLFNWFFYAARNFYLLPQCPLGGSAGDGTTCVVNPWGAGIITHESMHQHGYTHGANDQAGAKTACGYGSDPTWHFQVNTAPYIIGTCVDMVLRQSELTCGPLDTCPAGSVRILDGVGATSCHCEVDPGVDPMAGGPAAIMNGAGNLDVFVRGANSDVRERYYAGSGWWPWASRGGAVASQPSAVVYNGKTYLFARSGYSGAYANALLQRVYDPATAAWGTWQLVDWTPLGSAPAPVVSEGRIVVFARMPDGSLSHNIFTGSWSGWIAVPGGGVLASAPAAVVANGRLMVFARATDRSLVYKYYANGWSNWISLGGLIQSAPTATMVGTRLAVYVTNHEGIVHQIFSDNTGASWSGWMAFDGAVSSAPTAMMAGSRLIVFARGTDGALLYRYYENGWTGWYSLGS